MQASAVTQKYETNYGQMMAANTPAEDFSNKSGLKSQVIKL